MDERYMSPKVKKALEDALIKNLLEGGAPRPPDLTAIAMQAAEQEKSVKKVSDLLVDFSACFMYVVVTQGKFTTADFWAETTEDHRKHLDKDFTKSLLVLISWQKSFDFQQIGDDEFIWNFNNDEK